MVTYGNKKTFMETSMINLAIYGNPQMMLNLWCFPQNNLKSVQQFIAVPQDSAAPFWCGKWPFWPPFSAMSTPALHNKPYLKHFHPSINWINWIYLSHLRGLLDGDACGKVGSGDTFIDTLKAQRSGSGHFIKDEQPITKFFPILRTECGMVKLVKELQLWNAESPILVTDSWSNSSKSCSCEMQNLQS